MLFEAIFNLIVGVIGFIISLLPEFTPFDFDGIASWFAGLIPPIVQSFFAWLNLYVPVAEALTLVVTVATLWTGFLIYKLVVNVLVRLHLLGGS